MPTYEYECNCCSSRFEKRKSFNETPEACCPTCGGQAERIFTPVPIIFKGSGFYVTDSRGGNSHILDGNSGDKPKAGDTEKTKAGAGDKASVTGSDGAKDSGGNGARNKGGNGAKAGSAEKSN